MQDDQEKKRQAKEIEQDLNKGLSRRAFLDRLSAIGVGFGAAFVFGVNRSEAGVPADALVNLKSTNPVLNDIVQNSQQDQLPDGTTRKPVSSSPNTTGASATGASPTRVRLPAPLLPACVLPARRLPACSVRAVACPVCADILEIPGVKRASWTEPRPRTRQWAGLPVWHRPALTNLRSLPGCWSNWRPVATSTAPIATGFAMRRFTASRPF